MGTKGFESPNYMETKEFCGAARPSKSLKGKRWNRQCPLNAPKKAAWIQRKVSLLETLSVRVWRRRSSKPVPLTSEKNAIYDLPDNFRPVSFLANQERRRVVGLT